MRILVLSDSHGDYSPLKKAIEMQPDAEAVVFLGDGFRDFERAKKLLEGKRIYTVIGNNDFRCDYPKNQVINEGGLNIYITHGHYEYVKSSLGKIQEIAKQNGCQLVLYGHTHVQKEDNFDGVKLFCPGALRSDEYGVVDIIDNGFICIGINMK